MSEKPIQWKANVGAAPLCIAVFVNTFFTINCLIDYSVDVYARDTENPQLAVQFMKWREDGVVVASMNTFFLMFLPLALIDMIRANLQTVMRWRKASVIRNLVDFLQFSSLFGGILPIVLLYVIPVQQSFVDICSDAPKSSKCSASLEEMTFLHAIMVAVNVWMFSLDIAKYLGNSPKAASAVVDDVKKTQ